MAYPFRLVWCGQFEWIRWCCQFEWNRWCGQFEWIRWCGQFEWIRWYGQFKWLKPKYLWFAHAADTGCTGMCCYSSYTSLLLSPLFLHLLHNPFFSAKTDIFLYFTAMHGNACTIPMAPPTAFQLLHCSTYCSYCCSIMATGSRQVLISCYHKVPGQRPFTLASLLYIW